MTDTTNTAFTKPNTYELRTIQLSSPLLHIGSAVSQLNPFEYVVSGDKVYFPDTQALSKTLHQRGKLNDYISAIDHKESIAKLLQDTFGDQWKTIKDADNCPIFPQHLICQKWTKETITNLRPMIRNGMGYHYIPGSSIKGAIRSAIAYYLLRKSNIYHVPQNYHVSEIELKLREKIQKQELKKNAKNIGNQLLMTNLFSNYSLTYQDRPIAIPENSANTDFMRAIQVSDSSILTEKTLTNKDTGKKTIFNRPIVTEVIVSSRFPNYKAKYKSSLFVEMIHHVRTQFTIKLDTEMLHWFSHKQGMQIPFKNLEELLNICQTFAQEQWNAEHDYWDDITDNYHSGKNLIFGDIKDFYEPEKSPYQLRLGWATGLLGMTISLCLPDNLVQDIRDTCGIMAPGFEAPKSRRIAVAKEGNLKYPIGWTKLRLK